MVEDGRKVRKASKEELLHRIETILELLSLRKTRAEIIEYVEGETDWNVSAGQVDNYIRRARDEIESKVEQRAARLIGECLLDYETIYKLSMRDKQYMVALKAREMLDKRLGLQGVIDESRETGTGGSEMPDDLYERVRRARRVGPDVDED
jgi:hypothetical protein